MLEATRNQELSSFHAFIASRINHSCYMKRNVGTRSVHQIMFSMGCGVGWRGSGRERWGRARSMSVTRAMQRCSYCIRHVLGLQFVPSNRYAWITTGRDKHIYFINKSSITTQFMFKIYISYSIKQKWKFETFLELLFFD